MVIYELEEDDWLPFVHPNLAKEIHRLRTRVSRIEDTVNGDEQRMAQVQVAQEDLDAITAALVADDGAIAAEIATLNDKINSNVPLAPGDLAPLQAALASTATLVPATAPVAPAAALPQYTYSGTDPVDTTQWTAVPGTTPQQYTFSGDTAGQPATGDGLGGVWNLVTSS